jgi:CelD/BcsL family acetyltransferase involved in cellulose biosynthesis
MAAVELLTDTEALELLGPEWDRLAVECARPCSAPALLLAWWRHLAPSGAEPRVVAVREGARLVGLAPFFIHPGPLGRSQARLLGTPTMPQRSCILAASGYEAAVCAAAASALGRSDPRPAVLILERIDAAATWPVTLAAAWPAPARARLIRGLRVPGRVLSMDAGSFQAWLDGRSRNFRREVRRTAHRVEDAGGRVERAEDPAAAARALDAFERLHGARWGDRSRLWRPETMAMLREAAAELLGSGRMRLYTVTGPEGIVATLILFAAGGEVTGWNGGWDPAWGAARPSTALAHRAIADCFELGDRRLDWGENAPMAKLRLSDGDDPLAWANVLPRDLSYPLVRAATVPARFTGNVRMAVRRLPPPVHRALRDAHHRLSR